MHAHDSPVSCSNAMIGVNTNSGVRKCKLHKITLTSSSSKIRLYPLSPSLPVDAFEMEGHILVTLTLILQAVFEQSRADSWVNMLPDLIQRQKKTH